MPLSAERRTELIADYRDGLLEQVLPFWMERAIDREHGGYLTAFDRDGSLLDSDKSVWVQGRFAWLLGTLYNTVEPREEWLEGARHGVDFLFDRCRDTDGRFFFQVAQDGTPLRRRRYCFSEAFAALAASALARATGESRFAEMAREAFEIYWSRYEDPSLEPPKTTGARPAKAIGSPMIAINVLQGLRANLGDEGDTARIDRCIAEIRDDFVKPEREVVMETVGTDGRILDHFDGRTLNPGHAIEGAWFILHEAKVRGDEGLVKLGCQMLDWMWKRGWDEEHGGILYFVDLEGKPVQEYWHDMKFWWPQCETIIATLLAYQLTGEERYARWHEQIHDYTHKHFPDPEFGDWYGYLHRDGRISVPLKGNLWKGPFHIPRMQWYCWQLLEEDRR